MAADARSGEIREEERRVRYLQRLVDLTMCLIRQGAFTRREAEKAVAATRRRALELFPDKGPVYDLIYRPRFERLLREVFGPRPGEH